MARHFILIRPAGEILGGTVTERSAADMVQSYTAAELGDLARGQRIRRDDRDHLDLVASVTAAELAAQPRAAAPGLS